MIFFKKFSSIFFGISLLLILIGVFFLINNQRTHTEDILKNSSRVLNFDEGKVYVNNKEISVNIANTDELRLLGLSFTEEINENQGMIFIFDVASRYGFWMKDMNYPIDIIWIDKNYKIVSLTENFSPDTFPKLVYPDYPVKYVLEVKAGFIENNNLKIGDNIIYQKNN